MDLAESVDKEFRRVFSDLDRVFAIKRGTAYVLIGEGKIRSKMVRPKGSHVGLRLIDFSSVREFLARHHRRNAKANLTRDVATRQDAEAEDEEPA